MKNPLLRQKLKAWKLPEADDSIRSAAQWRALTAYRNRPANPDLPAEKPAIFSRIFQTPGWLPALGTLAIAALACLLFLKFESAPPRSNLLAELELLFPGQIEAVVKHGKDIKLRLDIPTTPRPPDQRVAVTLSVRDEYFEIFTYSGVPVRVEFSKGAICVTPLITGSGEVILLGESGLLDDSPHIHVAASMLHGI